MLAFLFGEIMNDLKEKTAKQLAENTLLAFVEAGIPVDVLMRFMQVMTKAIWSELNKKERIDFLLNINKAMGGEAITLKEETLH